MWLRSGISSRNKNFSCLNDSHASAPLLDLAESQALVTEPELLTVIEVTVIEVEVLLTCFASVLGVGIVNRDGRLGVGRSGTYNNYINVSVRSH